MHYKVIKLFIHWRTQPIIDTAYMIIIHAPIYRQYLYDSEDISLSNTKTQSKLILWCKYAYDALYVRVSILVYVC